MPLHRIEIIIGLPKSRQTFGKGKRSEVSDFSCLHENERYGTCDDAVRRDSEHRIVLATIPPTQNEWAYPHRLRVWTYSGDTPVYPEKKKNQDWRIKKIEQDKR